MKRIMAVLVCAAGLTTGYAGNVALNKPVTLNGTFGLGGWGSGILAAGSTLTDGVFLPVSTQWDLGTVWWDTRVPESMNNSITIDLGGTFSITGFTVQADDNDEYLLEYSSGGSWAVAAVGGWGMQTRQTTLASPITATSLRFTAPGIVGDGYYSVSEIQAEGRAVPEAASTLALLGGALAVMGILGRKTR